MQCVRFSSALKNAVNSVSTTGELRTLDAEKGCVLCLYEDWQLQTEILVEDADDDQTRLL